MKENLPKAKDHVKVEDTLICMVDEWGKGNKEAQDGTVIDIQRNGVEILYLSGHRSRNDFVLWEDVVARLDLALPRVSVGNGSFTGHFQVFVPDHILLHRSEVSAKLTALGETVYRASHILRATTKKEPTIGDFDGKGCAADLEKAFVETFMVMKGTGLVLVPDVPGIYMSETYPIGSKEWIAQTMAKAETTGDSHG